MLWLLSLCGLSKLNTLKIKLKFMQFNLNYIFYIQLIWLILLIIVLYLSLYSVVQVLRIVQLSCQRYTTNIKLCYMQNIKRSSYKKKWRVLFSKKKKSEKYVV